MSFEVSCQSPGKINLFLDILSKRPDHFHEIETLFLPIHQLSDRILIKETTKKLTIHCSHPSIPLNKNNLCWQAAIAFAETAKLQPNWEITIEKNIPVAGGMGGGSSNAATVLNLLNEAYNLPLEQATLHKIASQIGADVPFFLRPTPAIGTGTGTIVTNIQNNSQLSLLLLTFSFPVSAAWAYQHYKKNQQKKSLKNLQKALKENHLHNISKEIFNIFTPSLRDKFPILDQAINDLKSTNALSAEISGSGPTIFALFDSNDSAENAKKLLIKKHYKAKNIILATT